MEQKDSEKSSSPYKSEVQAEPEATMSARPYQVELLERAKERNTIVCLGTGTGKTFISVMLIKELAHEVRETYKNGGKRTFFLVNTVPLAIQQAKVIGKHTDLKVKYYVGEMDVDSWDKNKWTEEEFSENNVLVMTAQIFLDLLEKDYVKLSQVNLLIFDECHHAKGNNHPYRQIMQHFCDCRKDDYPKVVGLTASVVNKKVKPLNIESEIRELECTLRSTCETSQDEKIEKFAAKPKEEIMTFSKNCIDSNSVNLIEKLQEVLNSGLKFLQKWRVPDDKGPLRNAQWYSKSALRHLKECQETLSEMGPWAADRVAGYLIKDLERACLFQDSKEGRLFFEHSAAQLRQLQGVYRNCTSTPSSNDPDGNGQCYVMPKLQKLLGVLKKYGNSKYTESEQESNLCGIVFVERRYTALVLSEQINIIARLDHELTFIKSKFVVGHGTSGKGSYSSETEMNFKKQEKVLRQFRRHDFNLLIATSVVEEGLDIPECNLVCRFDFPKNYCSYVQSKGRARAKESRYYILVAEELKVEKESELQMMHAIENFLLEKCRNRTEPTDEECNEAADTHFLPPYKPENGVGASLTMNNSVRFLSRYCSKLPRDQFTQPKPVYRIEEDGDGYRCKLEMPINCQLRTTIVGRRMERKTHAKMAAAYSACIELRKIGELDDNWLPVPILSDEESDSEEEETEPGGGKRKKAGTKKRKRVYERKVPEAFIGSLVQDRQPQYLTAISIRITKLTSGQDVGISAPFFTDSACHMFSLLTNAPIPAVRPFKLYPDYGEVTVSLKCHKSQLHPTLTRRDLTTVQKFHCFLFSHVLRERVELKPKHEDGSADGYFVVLVKSGGRLVDCDLMEDAMRLEASLARSCDQSSRNELIREDMVVTKNYMDSRQRFAVVKVRRDVTPLSPFPDRSKAKTYESYFRQNYGTSVTIKDQPLIEVKDISDRVNFLVDRKQSSKGKHDAIILVPELCDVVPVRASLLSVSLMLPSILYRLNALLLVGDVKDVIAGKRHNTDESKLSPIGAGDANDEKSLLGADKSSAAAEAMEVDDDDDDDGEEFPGLFSDLRSLFRGGQGHTRLPDSALVLQALTTNHSGDAFNLERLEMLGDALLKLAVSLHLFCTYKDKDEGKLTQRKVKQISNLALFRAAAKKSLAGCQQSTQLARNTWCPTGCQFSDVSQESIAGSDVAAMEVDNVASGPEDTQMEVEDTGGAQGSGDKTAKCNTQVIADKSVADSIEALIGAYLISCGYVGTLRLMKFLGLKVLPEDDETDVFAEKSRTGCYARFWADQESSTGARGNEDLVSRMVSGLETFEKNSIHYTFRSKLHLLEALTHASYQGNRVTPCYQRLEFLGDALLDFLVTQHLYFRHAKLSPGQLTDIRQALVNNNIFATIAVQHKYNKYLKQMSPRWFKTIENFITRVEDENEERNQNHSHPNGVRFDASRLSPGAEKYSNSEVTADPFIIVSEKDEEGIKAPKVLGDIFESVAGAVFMDSGMDLIKVWGVYYRMMKPYIDHYSVNIPFNPIRRVHELDSSCAFSEAKTLPDGKIERTLRVHWGEFVGKGTNSKIAKATAAKRAVQAWERSTSHGTSPVHE